MKTLTALRNRSREKKEVDKKTKDQRQGEVTSPRENRMAANKEGFINLRQWNCEAQKT